LGNHKSKWAGSSALWTADVRDAPEDPPEPWGVFHSIAEAKAELRVNGVIDE
jgi:hypothetical protein